MRTLTASLSAVLIIALTFVLLPFIVGCNLTGGTAAGAVDNCSFLEGSARDNCYFEAMKCSKMKDPAFRDSCVAELAKAKKDLAVCDLIQKQKTKAYCQEQIAVLTSNPELCENIYDIYWADNCYYNVSVNNEEAEGCIAITNEVQQEKCYSTIAQATGNELLCEYLSGSLREKCLFSIAKKTKDIQVCQLLNKLVNRDSCRLKLAKLTGNREFCEYIGISAIRGDCLKAFGGK